MEVSPTGAWYKCESMKTDKCSFHPAGDQTLANKIIHILVDGIEKNSSGLHVLMEILRRNAWQNQSWQS